MVARVLVIRQGAVTSNLRLGAMPGNVRLRQGEAGLPRASVVNVSQIRTIDQARLGDRVGALGLAKWEMSSRVSHFCSGPMKSPRDGD